MNTTQLKNYAPKARKDFIEAIKVYATKFGISESELVEMMVRDDVVRAGQHDEKLVGITVTGTMTNTSCL